PNLHSVPTRRSSDLQPPLSGGTVFTARLFRQADTAFPSGAFRKDFPRKEGRKQDGRRPPASDQFSGKHHDNIRKAWLCFRRIFRSEEHTSELQSRFD